MNHNQIRPTSRFLSSILLTAFLANAALASGYMVAPEMRQKMPSFEACLAQLEERASEHRKQLISRTFAPDGGFREVNLEALSEGVKITGRKSARYEAKIWYHNGSPNKDGTQYEINHSWDQSGYDCREKTLIINASQGYTLSTFEPVATMKP